MMYRLTIFFHTPTTSKHITLWSPSVICPSSRLLNYLTLALRPLVPSCSRLTYYVTYVNTRICPPDNIRALGVSTINASLLSHVIYIIKNNFKNR